METGTALEELVIVVAVGVLVALLGARLRLPTPAALLLSGALVGPEALGIVSSHETIEALAEVGVVLLLFTIGLEFSLERLRRIAKLVVLGGSLQVGLTIGATVAAAYALGLPIEHGLFFGFLVALSSTAIVLRTLAERGEMDAPHGTLIVGVLIFQDLCVVPMLLLVPFLSGGEVAWVDLGVALAKAVGVVVATVLVSRVVVPRLFHRVDETRSREVFLLSVIVICLGTAWLTSLVGLSLALGAFLGGLVVSETEYGHRAMGDILPLRDVFMSIFFVSMGSLFDIHVLLRDPALVLGLAGALIAGKTLLATIAALAMRFPVRVAITAALGLAQFGEFGFVLARAGETAGIAPAEQTDALVHAGIITMFLTPVLVALAPRVGAGARILAPLDRLLGVRGIDERDLPGEPPLADHVVVVGYGFSGQLLCQTLAELGISYVALDLNADTVRRESARGVSIFYGDASSREALLHARIGQARAFVLFVDDENAAMRALQAGRAANLTLPIIARTRFPANRDRLVHAGADHVVVEQVESGLEMLAKTLRNFDVPRNVIDAHVERGRGSVTATDRRSRIPRRRLHEMEELDDLKVEKVLIHDYDFAFGKTLEALALRSRTQALVIAVGRGKGLVPEPGAAGELQAGDRVFLVGSTEAVADGVVLLTRGPQ
jgi:CPA2 family monovalent cation:H+ antiporter-2